MIHRTPHLVIRKVQNGIKVLQYSESYSYDDVVSGKNANIGTPIKISNIRLCYIIIIRKWKLPKDNISIHRL